MDINRVQLKGRLGKNPEHTKFDGGGQLSGFSLATTSRWKNKEGEIVEKTLWHRIKAFGKTAEVAKKYLKKGNEVFLEGSINYTEWDDPKSGEKREGVEILVSNLSLLTRPGTKSENKSTKVDTATPEFTSEDIPF